MQEIKEGTPVVAKYGFNKVLNKPFEFLFDFGYEAVNDRYVVYVHGERNMQDSLSVPKEQIRIATEEDLKTYYWGT